MATTRPFQPRRTAWRLRGLLILAGTLLMAACSQQPVATATPPCRSPDADMDWPVASFTQAGFDEQALCSVLTGVAKGRANIHSVLVERHGRLVAELYRGGPDSSMEWAFGLHNPFAPDASFDAQALHDVRSVTKSITALVVGIEMDKGRLPGPAATVVSLDPELTGLRGREQAAVTLEHLLTMTSGLEWQEWGHSLLTSDEIRLFWKQDTAHFVVERPVVAPPGTAFRYSGGNTQMLGELLQRATGRSLAALAQEALFDPMGVRPVYWATDTHGRPLAFVGLRMRPRDMLKFGRLVNQRGAWQGRQLVPAAWMDRATHTRVPSGYSWFSPDEADAGYGYQWWTGRLQWRGQELEWTSAVGNGGQRIFVLPALDLSIVLTGGDYGELGIHREEAKVLSGIVAAVLR